ncbi:MAG: TIGR01777 family oxidoreductase [Legionellaceae bacterium]|nr:TIGR01777 family oxidoreductase [Legionellaceae bacterium]
MKFLIAGGTGFIGTYLADYLAKHGHEVLQLTRSLKKAKSARHVLYWDGEHVPDNLQPDVIINLCGLNISDKRWSETTKKELMNSRVIPTRGIVSFIKHYAHKKPILINASAIGFYPSCTEIQTEHDDTPSQPLFSKYLVEQWEAAARDALQYQATVVCLRFGVVLGKNGGMLKKLLPSYRWGLGATLGDKSTFLSWVHIEDLCRAVLYVISLDKKQPVYNITSPAPCTKRDFSETLAAVCKKPCFLSLPEYLVLFLFGEMGRELLLSDQQIIPQHLLEAGFEFKYKTIQAALEQLLENNKNNMGR